MKKILVPVDGSEYSLRAVEKAKEFATAFGSTIVLLNVSSIILPSFPNKALEYVDFDQLQKDIEIETEAIFEGSKKVLGDSAKNAETIFIYGDPANQIVNYLESNDIDLVIMGSHGQGSLMQRLFVGSVATKVLHSAKQPVLIVK